MKSKITEEISNIFRIIFDPENHKHLTEDMFELAMQTLRTILSNKVKRQYFHKQKPSKVNV
jgi:hypothetical protein